ncbi:MAG: SdrD B-like domain-containing protein [Bacteroidota bacterium]
MNQLYRTVLPVLCCFFIGKGKAEIWPSKANFFAICADRTASNTSLCFSGNDQGLRYGGYIKLAGYNSYYRMTNGRFVEFLDGTAQYTATWINVHDDDIRFLVDVQLSGRTSNRPTNSPKAHHCLNPNTDNYYYYTHTSGTLTGRRDVNGAILKIARFGEAFQVGIGANVTHDALTFGASGWLMLMIERQPNTHITLHLEAGENGNNGDININLNGSPTACTDNNGAITLTCPNDITVTADQGQNGATVNFSTPNATTTCMVAGGINCNIIPNTISGFKYLGEFQGSKYYCSDTDNFTYDQARSISMQNGGYPAVICGNAENNFLANSLLASEAWIGYSDAVQEGTFRWVNGENCNYTNWKTPGEPNNITASDHLSGADFTVLRKNDKKWYDRNRRERYEFIMEIPCQPSMNPSNISVSQVAGPTSGSTFSVGMIDVTFEAVDECGNTERCTFKVTVNPPADPCATKGGDNDGDGICADDDCDDNNANIGAQQVPGTACNDGDSNTENDVILADGCACAGTIIDPCAAKGGDNDGDGICADDDCDDNNANIGAQQAPGTACNDGDPNTENDVILADGCACAGTIVDPCAAKGGDNDGDGICADDDCDDNNANVGAKQIAGTSCDDGDNNTTNDVIQADGCTCAGTFAAKAAVGDFVFRDDNGNGIQDAGEPGLRNIFVLLTNVNTGVAKFDITGADGKYAFTELNPGNYTIKFAGQSNELTVVDPGQGNDPTKDSDYNPIDGITPIFTLAAGEVNNDIDAGFKPRNIMPVCTAEAGTLSGGGSVTIVAGSAPVSAIPNGDAVVPPGFSLVYVLTAGEELIIQQTNTTPDFVVENVGKYTVHTLVYDPATLDLSIVVPGLTTGFDVNSLLVQGGGTICAALDVAGAMTMVMSPTTGCPGNVMDGGRIGNDEDPADCGPYDPTAMVSLAGPSGGSGTVEYIWLSSTLGCPSELTDQIVGATGATFDPGVITQTTYYVRCARVIGCTEWIESNCVIKKVDDCGTGGDLTCDDSIIEGGEGKINLSNIPANAIIEYNGPATRWAVIKFCEGDCNTSDMITGLTAGAYNVKIQSFNPYCYRSIPVVVTDGGGSDPCANAGGDSDGDGICDDVDNCRNTQNPNQADTDGDGIGNVCDDTPNGGGNTGTCDDAIITGGESKITLSNIPANAIVEYNGPATQWAVIKFCDGDCNVSEMITDLAAGEYTIKIQSFNPYCYRSETVVVTGGGNADPCASLGGDSDGDGICNDVDNCRNTQNPDQADNDGDGIGNVCDDTPNGGSTDPCANAGGDSDGDGICDDVDNCRHTQNPDQADNDGDGIGNVCDETPNGEIGGSDCNDAVVSVEPGKVVISNISANAKVEIAGPATGWAQQLVCEGDCQNMEMVTDLAAGDYNVTIQSFDPYCYNRVAVVVPENNGGGNDPCVNAGGDADGDGICDNVDNCRSTPNPDQADNDGDGIGNLCDDTPDGNGGGGEPSCNDVVVSVEPGKAIVSNLTAPIVAINILDKNAGYGSVFECFNDCEVPIAMITLPASDYLVKVQFYTANWGFNCEKEFHLTVPAEVDPCVNAGGDADGDGICANEDCDDTNPNIGATQLPGTACNDGNPDTENDVIQADGCSCVGTPVGPSKCANRTVSNTTLCTGNNAGTIYGFYLLFDNLHKFYTFHDGLFMEFDDGTAMLTGKISNIGDSQIGFDVNVNLSGRTQNSPTGAPKANYCLAAEEAGFYYYADLTGTLMGTGKAAGAVVTLRDFAEAFQVGNGANITHNELRFGASGWLTVDVQSQPSGNLHLNVESGNNGQNGDININLTGDGTECPSGASSRNGGPVDRLAQAINIFPNPAQEELFVNLTPFAGKKGTIQMTNLYGQLVQEVVIDKIATGSTRLDLRNFQNGVYHLTIKAENVQPVTKRILVSRMY